MTKNRILSSAEFQKLARRNKKARSGLAKGTTRPVKHFFPMPIQMFVQWQIVTRLRRLQRQAVEGGQPFAEAG